MERRCFMTPLVEPLRDGRLDAGERATIERHLETCPHCRALQRDLDRLASLLRASSKETSTTLLDHHRSRMRLLQTAALLDPSPRTTLGGLAAAVIPPRASWAVPLAAAAVAMLALAGAGRSSAPRAPTPAAAVTTAPPAAEEPTAQASPPAPAPAPAPEIPQEIRTAAAKPRPPATPPSSPPAPPATKPETKDSGFASGVGSLEQGNFGEAVDRLAALRKSHPDDSRAEDAAFLVIVALQRAGRQKAAAAAAREYLASYPSGYRRGEAQRIAAQED